VGNHQGMNAPSQYCPAGEYACNKKGGCCPMDFPTPDPPPQGDGPGDGGGTNPPAGCTATKPTNMTATRTSQNNVTFTWTPGANGQYQAFFIVSVTNFL